VLVVARLAAPERSSPPHRVRRRAAPLPAPAASDTARATIIDVGRPFASDTDAARWLSGAGEPELAGGVAVLNRALLAVRALTADPYLNPVTRAQALAARVGFGAGEEVADGRWREALELTAIHGRRRRARAERERASSANSRLAAALAGRWSSLICEELTVRARLDLDLGRTREAALQLAVALDGALAERSAGGAPAPLGDRLEGLVEARARVSAASEAALTRALSRDELATVERTLAQLEAALRARVLTLDL